MAYEIFDGTDVVRQLFREGESVTDEAGDALPPGESRQAAHGDDQARPQSGRR
jgi:hypothetical protein